MYLRVLPPSYIILLILCAISTSKSMHYSDPTHIKYEKEKRARVDILNRSGCPSIFLSNHDKRLENSAPLSCISSLWKIYQNAEPNTLPAQVSQQLLCQAARQRSIREWSSEIHSHCFEQNYLK